ncbi:helix-turn-helix transcriptional regulator [uncultured Roseobacter sp.]|uniref:helix-turn-helix domain-containing protein n=1 Tax=uncultured Roseobacter sp. TaxID=114847 RepID=UPI002628082D|nr:helix-turn-helix transcriptional regulator [uncultured Roseobacter sp.]
MKIKAILQAVDAYEQETGKSDRAISLEIGMSESAIRNWRRRLEAGEKDASIGANALVRLAKVLNVDPADFTEIQPPPASGFEESYAVAWEPQKAFQVEDVMKSLAPKAKSPCPFKLTRDAPAFNLSKGDILILDLNSSAKTGDIVLANRVDPNTGSAETLLGRYLPPYISPPNASEKPQLVDSNLISVMGPVVASFRPDANSAS